MERRQDLPEERPLTATAYQPLNDLVLLKMDMKTPSQFDPSGGPTGKPKRTIMSSGVVVAVGKGLKEPQVKVGDHVALHSHDQLRGQLLLPLSTSADEAYLLFREGELAGILTNGGPGSTWYGKDEPTVVVAPKQPARA